MFNKVQLRLNNNKEITAYLVIGVGPKKYVMIEWGEQKFSYKVNIM